MKHTIKVTKVTIVYNTIGTICRRIFFSVDDIPFEATLYHNGMKLTNSGLSSYTLRSNNKLLTQHVDYPAIRAQLLKMLRGTIGLAQSISGVDPIKS